MLQKIDKQILNTNSLKKTTGSSFAGVSILIFWMKPYINCSVLP